MFTLTPGAPVNTSILNAVRIQTCHSWQRSTDNPKEFISNTNHLLHVTFVLFFLIIKCVYLYGV